MKNAITLEASRIASMLLHMPEALNNLGVHISTSTTDTGQLRFAAVHLRRASARDSFSHVTVSYIIVKHIRRHGFRYVLNNETSLADDYEIKAAVLLELTRWRIGVKQ